MNKDLEEAILHGGAKTLAEKFTGAVNSFSFRPASKDQDIGPSIYRDDAMRKKFLPLAFGWLRHLNAVFLAKGYDARNLYACRTASKLLCVPQIGEYAVVDDNPAFTEAFVETMARQHRTLQQQFSGICFYVIDRAVRETADPQELDANMRRCLPDHAPDFWNAPLI